MDDPHRPQRHADVPAGLGTLCAEAQADGVPCIALGIDCAVCERAHPGLWHESRLFRPEDLRTTTELSLLRNPPPR